MSRSLPQMGGVVGQTPDGRSIHVYYDRGFSYGAWVVAVETAPGTGRYETNAPRFYSEEAAERHLTDLEKCPE